MTTSSETRGFANLVFTKKSPADMVSLASAFADDMSTRRSVREFSSEELPIEVIEHAIRAAASAPSGANKQPWHFVVVSNPDTKREIRIAAEEEERKFYQQRATTEWLKDLEPLGTNSSKPFLQTAPYLIVIFAEKFEIDDGGNKHKNYYTAESVGIATGLLISALHLAGVATLTHTPSPMKFLNKILNRPASEKPYLILVAGLPADDTVVPNIQKKSFSDNCTFVD